MPLNQDKADSSISPVTGDAMKSIINHIGADTDASTLAIHHTLGPKPFQASPGSHVHDGKDSKKIKLSNVIVDTDIAATNGVPAGGTDGQVLTKQGSTNYVAGWEDPGAAAYTSVVKHQVKAGTALTKGQAVYVTSANGTNIIVSKASNVSEATSSKTMGLIETSLSINGFGYVVTEGLLAGLNTSAAAAGDAVWLGVDGALIYGLNNKPVAPTHLVFIGIVTRSNANNGEIFIAPQNGFELKEIHDVLIDTGSVANNEVLAFDSASSLWVNHTAAEAGLSEIGHTHVAANITDLQTALDAKVDKATTAIGTLANLNTYTTSGYSLQASNAAAAGGTNYPIAYAGLLEVVARADAVWIFQRYTTYQLYNVMYHRSYLNGTWSAWKSYVPSSTPPSYTHTQGTSSATWTITHTMGYRPNVTVIDSGGATIEGELLYNSNSTLTVTFSQAVSGVAYLS